MTRAAKAYVIEFGSSMLAYSIVLPLSLTYITHHQDSPARYVIALAPVVPMLFALAALLRFLGRVDEMQRRIQLDAFAVAAGATGLCTFAYAMLENVGAPRIGFEWILPFIIVVWGLTGAVATWRYNR
ncbi:MAG TPA: hypothetical protein VGW96_07140 [Candidatus Eremiobacteraceae bacterium]|nr:hypothetical protein [Candidatus Eremiobacteraceae bacterium]